MRCQKDGKENAFYLIILLNNAIMKMKIKGDRTVCLDINAENFNPFTFEISKTGTTSDPSDKVTVS